ncbi:hypothetical protein BCV70DRAFT_197031 [Testicularia cyperi]|uniref:RRM domain-containing protein n=1 Tax=Testicularia cyperi TaxID=1882483 RepID=A0A317XXE7_9BASI|nr:hypothetical protein BCV70DRAFT_197031 [Testicularia cyperi]
MKQGRSQSQRNLYVLNLPLDATTDHFEALFGQYGRVEHAVILATLDNVARRRGFILMSQPSEAMHAIERLDGYSWHGYRIEVSYAIVQRSGTPFPQVASANADDLQHPPRSESQTDNMNLVKSSVTSDSWSSIREQTSERATHPGTTLESAHDASCKWRRAPTSPTQMQAAIATMLLCEPRESATLQLDCLDTAVVSSESFIRALTQPFGQVKSATFALDDVGTGRGVATVQYCCHHSAVIAKRALDGLVIGKSPLAAQLSAPQRPIGDERVRDKPGRAPRSTLRG